MTPTELITECRRYGAEFIRDREGTLRVRAPEPLPAALLAELRRHKAELLAVVVSATKPLNPAVVLAEIDGALRGLRHDPDGSRAWQLIDTDTELHGRFEAAERTIEAAQRDGDDSGMRAAVADYRGVIGEALARVRARREAAVVDVSRPGE